MSSGSCEGSFGSFCDGGLGCLSTSVYCSVVCRCSLLPLLASGATQCLRDQKLRLLWRSCMSVRSLPIAYLGFSCRVPTYFMCTASTGFVKAFFFVHQGSCTTIRAFPGLFRSGTLGTYWLYSCPLAPFCRAKCPSNRGSICH